MTAVPDLARWLPRRRWFQGKDRPIADVRVVDHAVLLAGARWLLLVVDHADGGREHYQLVVLPDDVASPAGDAEPVTIDGTSWVEATADPPALGQLARLAAGSDGVTTDDGATIEGAAIAPRDVPADGRLLGVEQTNTSVVFGETALLKLFRRLEVGEHPDVELTGALTRAGSTDVPAQIGALTLRRGGRAAALGVVSEFVPDAHDGWGLAVIDARDALGDGGTDPTTRPFVRHLRALGAAVARVHGALAGALPSAEATRDDVAGWAETVRSHVAAVLDGRHDDAVVDPTDVLAAVDRAADGVSSPGLVCRIHGDLHLGQVVDGHDGWQLLDFEGEPARTLDERRAPGPPARDVAGMVRSFDYAAAAGLAASGAAADDPLPDALAAWRDAARDSFLDGYQQQAGHPVDPGLLALFELDKAVYEIGYERANRPDWLAIPLGGVRRILRRVGAGERATAHETTPDTDTLREDETMPDDTAASDQTVPGDDRTASERSGGDQAAVPATDDRAPDAGAAGDSTTATGDNTATGATAADAGGGATTVPAWQADLQEARALLDGTHTNPHRVLGLHSHEDATVVRVLRPGAAAVSIAPSDGEPVAMEQTHEGFFEALLPTKLAAPDYRLRFRNSDGHEYETHDPYAFWPTLGDIDLHLVGEGRHEELWRRLGAHVTEIDGVSGTAFAVWAPNARSVRVVGSFNDWDGRRYPMRVLGNGIWELFVPGVAEGDYYKYEVLRSDDFITLHADPYAQATEAPPANSSRVFSSTYEWGDGEWMSSRPGQQWHSQPLSVYEVHLGSWKHDDGRPLTYRELAHQLADYADEMGFTHIELLPVAEHPFTGSWGYQVTGHFAPTARFGGPDDFRYLVDHLHQRGVGVIVDWVPAHFPKDEWALARFDGTALYEHADPRQGEHPDWGTLVFNFGRNEVRNFLLASALFWLEELHVDGLRVDAVASMLYLDYSREEGEWVPNAYGGNENLEAIEFLKETTAVVYGRNPGALMIAEESTAWPGVSRPVYLGGLGFGFKWNMGWMHDTLSYFARDPIHRRHHHNELTFGLLYAWSENYVLPLSHDEVVHGKRSLIDKMPGDRWQKFANLRALYGYMWAHPGKQLLFMGSEFGQWREWSESTDLDWYLLSESDHLGLQRLVGDLNRTYRQLPALWERDHQPEGFQWIDANNADANLISFVRYADDGTPLVCIANLAPLPRYDQRFGLPQEGRWRELLNTDSDSYGGGNVGNMGVITAEREPWHGMTASAAIAVPPLATLWLVPDEQSDQFDR